MNPFQRVIDSALHSSLKATSEGHDAIKEQAKDGIYLVSSSSPRYRNSEAPSSKQLGQKLDPKSRHERSSSSSPNFSVRFRRKKTGKKLGDTRPKSMVMLSSSDMAKADNTGGNHMPLHHALNNKSKQDL